MEDGALIDVTLVATNQGHDENKKHLIMAEPSENRIVALWHGSTVPYL